MEDNVYNEPEHRRPCTYNQSVQSESSKADHNKLKAWGTMGNGRMVELVCQKLGSGVARMYTMYGDILLR